MGMNVMWNPKEDAMLGELFGQGVSFSVIASLMGKEFKRPVSRNAAIGRAHRLGLGGRTVVRTPEERAERAKQSLARQNITRAAKRANRPVSRLRAANSHGAMHMVESFETDQRAVKIADVVPRHVAMIDLSAEACRYPYGDGPYTFCGCGTAAGVFYCEPHQRLTHSTARESYEGRKARERAIRTKMIAGFVAA